MPISRMFNAAPDALGAVADLKQGGYGGVEIHVFTKTVDNVSADSIVKTGISVTRAREYAERVNRGGALVVIDAPLGGAAQATEILERRRAGDSGVAKAVYEQPARNAATPLSSAFDIKMLSDNPAPFSSFWHLPTLSRQQGPKSSSFGLRLLWGKAAPLSSLIGMKLLSNDAAPLSARLGRKLLLDNAAPLSSRLGLPVLAKRRSARP